MPLLWESGVGADISARTAAPVVGGLWSCMLLTLLVLPAAHKPVASSPAPCRPGHRHREGRGRRRLTRKPT